MVNTSSYDTIILMGPIGVGKTTIGKLLAMRIGCSFTSLDDLEENYTSQLGYDRSYAMKIARSEGGFPYYEYRRSFFEEAVIRFLDEHREGVLELGGGHPILPDGANQHRVSEALKPFNNSVLLLPTLDVEESVALLKKHRNLPADADDFNELFFRDNRFFELSKHVVTTWGKSKDEVAQEVLGLLG